MSTRAIDPVLDTNGMWRDRRSIAMTHEQALRRVRSDYLELPGLTLTLAQAARLWSLSSELATAVLEELTGAGFLVCREGVYMRR